MKFSDFGFHPSLLKSIEQINYNECTPIQKEVIPLIMQGKDVAGLAQTGTGKTAAFIIPLMDRILKAQTDDSEENKTTPQKSEEKPEGDQSSTTNTLAIETRAEPALESEQKPLSEEKVQSKGFSEWKKQNFILVLVPTRELAEQVMTNINQLGEFSGFHGFAVYGGTGYDKQKEAIRQNVDFVVATPGRLIDLYKDHVIDLKQVRSIVFDEADRMFDMGFKDDMKYILQRTPRTRQLLMFSATLNFDVLNTAYEFGAEPIEVDVSRDQAKAENVRDELFHVGHDEKPRYVLSLLKKMNPKQVIIFSNFKNNIERISDFLNANGFPALGISSLLTQQQRTRVISLFKSENEKNILVATDVAARGLDIVGVDLIINYELPLDAESYVHRIGRTGRAGLEGRAISLVSDRDVESLQRIESYLKNKVTISWLEESELVKDMKEIRSENNYRGSSQRGDEWSQSSSGSSSSFSGGKDQPQRDRNNEDWQKDSGNKDKASTSVSGSNSGHSRRGRTGSDSGNRRSDSYSRKEFGNSREARGGDSTAWEKSKNASNGEDSKSYNERKTRTPGRFQENKKTSSAAPNANNKTSASSSRRTEGHQTRESKTSHQEGKTWQQKSTNNSWSKNPDRTRTQSKDSTNQRNGHKDFVAKNSSYKPKKVDKKSSFSSKVKGFLKKMFSKNS